MTLSRILKPYSISRVFLLSIPVLLFIHIIALIFYTEEHKAHQHQVEIHQFAQKLDDLVYLSKTIPSQNLNKLNEAITVFNSTNFMAKIENAPRYALRLHSSNFATIQQAIPAKQPKVGISLLIAPNLWLNVKASIHPSSVVKQSLLLTVEALIAIMITIYVWSIQRFIRPLSEFRQTAEQLGIDIQTKLPAQIYRGPTIVRETAQAIHKMQERIQDLLRDRTQMLAAISHDLRTPITRLKLRAHMMPDTELEKKIIADLDEMDMMIGEIISFARGDFLKEEKIKVDLYSMLKAICDDMSDLGKSASFSAKTKQLTIYGRSLSLKRAFTNLIQNALKYGKTAEIFAEKRGKKIIVTIDDTGSGISEGDLQKVFTPFYRGDHSRSRAKNTSGSGLGLTIARDAILSHGGSIQLENRAEGGLRVTIILFSQEAGK